MTFFVVNTHDEIVDNVGVSKYERWDQGCNWRAHGYESLGLASDAAHKFTSKEQTSFGVVELKTRFVFQPKVERQDF